MMCDTSLAHPANGPAAAARSAAADAQRPGCTSLTWANA
jgi:hypothetical protein